MPLFSGSNKAQMSDWAALSFFYQATQAPTLDDGCKIEMSMSLPC
jgi:hypothetical protein